MVERALRNEFAKRKWAFVLIMQLFYCIAFSQSFLFYLIVKVLETIEMQTFCLTEHIPIFNFLLKCGLNIIRFVGTLQRSG